MACINKKTYLAGFVKKSIKCLYENWPKYFSALAMKQNSAPSECACLVNSLVSYTGQAADPQTFQKWAFFLSPETKYVGFQQKYPWTLKNV